MKASKFRVIRSSDGNTLPQTDLPPHSTTISPPTVVYNLSVKSRMSALGDEKRDQAAPEQAGASPIAEIDRVTQEEAKSDVALPQLETSSPLSESSKKREEYIQFASLCFCLFLAGWNDGTTGPLLNRIKDVYHVSFLPLIY